MTLVPSFQILPKPTCTFDPIKDYGVMRSFFGFEDAAYNRFDDGFLVEGNSVEFVAIAAHRAFVAASARGFIYLNEPLVLVDFEEGTDEMRLGE